MILDCLDGGPAFQRILAHIPPKSTLLDPSKGNVGAKHGPCIHRNLACLQGFGDTVSPIDVVGEKRRAEPMVRVVCPGDYFFFRGKLSNALEQISTCLGHVGRFSYRDRSKYLLAHNCGVVRHVRECGILHEIPLGANPLAAK